MRTTLSKALFGIANGGPRLEPVGFDTAAIERRGARIQPTRHIAATAPVLPLAWVAVLHFVGVA